MLASPSGDGTPCPVHINAGPGPYVAGSNYGSIHVEAMDATTRATLERVLWEASRLRGSLKKVLREGVLSPDAIAALKYAGQNINHEVAEALRYAGRNINYEVADALMFAGRNINHEVADALMCAGRNINHEVADALRYAGQNINHEVADMLSSAGKTMEVVATENLPSVTDDLECIAERIERAAGKMHHQLDLARGMRNLGVADQGACMPSSYHVAALDGRERLQWFIVGFVIAVVLVAIIVVCVTVG